MLQSSTTISEDNPHPPVRSYPYPMTDNGCATFPKRGQHDSDKRFYIPPLGRMPTPSSVDGGKNLDYICSFKQKNRKSKFLQADN